MVFINLIKLLVFSFLFLCAINVQAQPTISSVFSPNTIGTGSSSEMFITLTNNDSSFVDAMSFTLILPTLPSNLLIAGPLDFHTDCATHTGDIIAIGGSNTVSMSGVRLGAGQSCEIEVLVIASTPGVYTIPAIILSSSAGTSMSLPVTLTVDNSLPSFTTSFTPASVTLGSKSTHTYTIDNSANVISVGNLDFTEILHPGLEIASPANVSTDCISPILPDTLITAVPGTNIIIVDASGSNRIPGFEVLPAGAICTVNVDVLATGIGEIESEATPLLADFVNAGLAITKLSVTITDMSLSEAFIDDPVPPGGTVVLRFELKNLDRNFNATNVSFTDDFTTMVPAIVGLTMDSLISNDCGGTVTGVGSTLFRLTGATVPSQGSCEINVGLTIPAGTTLGTYANTTSAISATVGGSTIIGNIANDKLFVEHVPVLTKEFLQVGTLTPDPIVKPGDDVVIRYSISNTSPTSSATDLTFMDVLTRSGTNTQFLTFPVTAIVPATTSCGGSTSLIINTKGENAILLTGGSLTATPTPGSSCSFDVIVTIPPRLPSGVYTSTTEPVSATVHGASRIGKHASDTLTVLTAPNLHMNFIPETVAPGGTTTLEYTLQHRGEGVKHASNITFSDDLNASLAGLNAILPSTPNPPCGVGSSLVGSAGNTLLTMTGGSLAVDEFCTFSVTLNVPAAAASGNYNNVSSAVSATVIGLLATSDPANGLLKVAGMDFTKEFLGGPVIPGDVVTLRYTIANVHPTDDATITSFSDDLNSVLTGLVATGAPTVNTCGGALSGTAFLIYSGGSVLSGATCTIEVPVLVPLGTVDHHYNSTTSVLLVNQGGAVVINPAVDILEVSSTQLQLLQQFSNNPVAAGNNVTLEFTLTNMNATQAVSAINFTDDLGATIAGLTFNSLISNTCGGMVTGAASTMINVSNIALPAGGSCLIQLDVMVPIITASSIYTNTTSPVSGILGGLPVFGDVAIDDLEVIELLLFSKAFDGPTTATGTAILTYTIINPGAITVDNISFFDDLNTAIPGLIAISLPSVPCGMTSSMTGIGLLSFSGGSLPPMGGTCSFSVTVLVPSTATAGIYPSTTSNLTGFGLKYSNPITTNLIVAPPPTFAKSFTPNSIGLGQTSNLTFVIDNTANAVAASALDFTDNLPAGLLVDTVPALTNSCGGTVSAVAASGSITLTGGSVAAGASCTLQVATIANTSGVYVNTTGDLSSSSGNSGTASDTLTVLDVPILSKNFTSASVTSGNDIELNFIITNNASIPATLINFTDDLDAFISGSVASNLPQTNICGVGSSLTGTNVINLSNASLAANSSCQFSVMVSIPLATLSNSFVNVTSPLSAELAGTAVVGASGSEASASLMIIGIPIVVPVMHDWESKILLLLGFLLLSLFFMKIRKV